MKKFHPVPFPPLPRRLRTPWEQITYFTYFCDSEVRGNAQRRLIGVASGLVDPSLPTLRPALLSHWLLTASPKPASTLLWETVTGSGGWAERDSPRLLPGMWHSYIPVPSPGVTFVCRAPGPGHGSSHPEIILL